MVDLKKLETPQRSERQENLVQNACGMAADGEVIGYVVLVMRPDGSCATAVHRPTAQEHQIGNYLFRAWVHEAVSKALD